MRGVLLYAMQNAGGSTSAVPVIIDVDGRIGKG